MASRQLYKNEKNVISYDELTRWYANLRPKHGSLLFQFINLTDSSIPQNFIHLLTIHYTAKNSFACTFLYKLNGPQLAKNSYTLLPTWLLTREKAHHRVGMYNGQSTSLCTIITSYLWEGKWICFLQQKGHQGKTKTSWPTNVLSNKPNDYMISDLQRNQLPQNPIHQISCSRP